MTDKRKKNIDRCSICGVLKTKENTDKSNKARNGFQTYCKSCNRAYVRGNRRLRQTDGRHIKTGIDSWDQVGSVLRELSELQYKINTETELCQKRIAMIEEYSQEITDPCIAHQIGLRIMLENFIKKACGGGKR
jgi:hypothetical protein